MVKKNNKVGESTTNFKQSDSSNFKQSDKKGKLYRVVFRQNRSREAVINRELFRWESPIEYPVLPLDSQGKPKYKKGVPAEIVNSKDFESIKKEFNIMEV